MEGRSIISVHDSSIEFSPCDGLTIFPLWVCRRKSQIQTFLEQNEGAGLQHLALKTDDIFATMRKMRDAEENFGGFELMKRPSEQYYQELPGRLGDKLSVSAWKETQFLHYCPRVQCVPSHSCFSRS
jgi:4-hydroxyphenylpyruvate dioxygenase-like putative hemolysin